MGSFNRTAHKARAKVDAVAKLVVDGKAEARLAEGTCRPCFYLERPFKVGMRAMTQSKCIKCEVEMVFGSSIVDKYCKQCSEALSVCVHCGESFEQIEAALSSVIEKHSNVFKERGQGVQGK